MPVITTIGAQEDFIVQMNGDYNVPFDEMALAVAAVSGQVVAVGDGFGIVGTAVFPSAVNGSGQWAIGTRVRVMTRGNPTTVNAQALVGYVAATHDAAFADAGIVVVNK